MNERLTVVAENVMLADVLREVARQTGSSVTELERVPRSVSIDVRNARLLDALRPVLADVDYIMQYSVQPDTGIHFHVWLYGNSKAGAVTSSASPAASSVNRAALRDDNGPGFFSFDAAVQTFSPEPFPSGPSPAEAEVARLNETGFFNSSAPEGPLLAATKAANWGVRVRALETLAVRSTAAGIAAITNAVNDEHPFVRSAALDLLASMGGKSAQGTRRLGDLLESKDPEVRFTAATALGEQAGDEAAWLLQRALGDEDHSVRAMAAHSLRQNQEQTNRQHRPRQ